MLQLLLYYFLVIFNDIFFKKSYGSFVKSIYHGMLPIFLVVVRYGVCKFVWSYGIIVSFFTTFFSNFVCFFIAFNISISWYLI